MRRGLFVALLLASPTAVAETQFRPIVVLHNVGAPVTRDYISGVLARMNRLVADAPGCHDIRFYIGAEPKVSSEVPYTLNTFGQQNKMFALSEANVIVTSLLEYCGDYNPGYGGCSGSGVNAIVEYFVDQDIAAHVWLHEVGHSHKLPHVAHDARLMYREVRTGRSEIVTEECDKYRVANLRFPSVEAALVPVADQVAEMPETEPGAETVADVDPSALLESVLADVWMHGTPRELLDRLFVEIPDFLEEVRVILLRGDKELLWPNAVTTLGEYGDESDISFIQAFALRQHQPSESANKAKANVPYAIGYLSGRYRSPSGLAFLERSATTAGAASVIGDDVPADVADALTENFAQGALLALALAEGEISRQASRGEASMAEAALAEGAIARLTSQITGDDRSVPVAPEFAADFIATLNQIRIDVQVMGLEEYGRANNE